MIEDATIGALAAALAKAQAAFPAIPREKEVTVQTKTGGKYTFKYAPLDVIIAAVRPALSTNGLAIAQLLDGFDLVTMLLHESGATLSGRMPVPRDEDQTVQQLGSAITYLRRYSLQAMLGIASEEDDDGNAAAGNKATPVRRERFLSDVVNPEPETAFDAGLVGIAEQGKGVVDFELRQTSTGHVLMFRLSEKAGSRAGMKVIAKDALAQMVAEYRTGIEGQRVTCWGSVEEESFDKGGKTIHYQVLNLSRLKVGALDLSAPEHEPSEDEDALIEELGQLAFGNEPVAVQFSA